MRPYRDVQRAHDMLTGILLGNVPLKLEDQDRRHINACCDVLCWVLEHDHNEAFAANLQEIEAKAFEAGYMFPKFPNRPLPDPSADDPSGAKFRDPASGADGGTSPTP